jgi:hypothetical protein
MPEFIGLEQGNVSYNVLLGIKLTPALVVANTTAEQTFTVPGLSVGDNVQVSKPTTQAGLGIVNARVSAANTLAIAYCNTTAGSLTPTAGETYQLEVNRPSYLPLPNAIY